MGIVFFYIGHRFAIGNGDNVMNVAYLGLPTTVILGN
jgi:hypothetical protein